MIALQSHDVELRIGYKPLLQNVSLSIEASEIVSLSGPNGTGKTSLLRVFAGLAKPHLGRVTVLNEQLWPENAVTKEHLACFLASSPALLLDHPVDSNLEFMCNAFGVIPARSALNNARERVGLGPRGEQISRTLSTGQKRRLTLAVLLLLKPRIVFADEPTNGLDTAGQELCTEIFSELATTEQSAILIATHDHRLLNWCQRDIGIEQFLPSKLGNSRRSIRSFE